MEKLDILMIVAHPDDEILFGFHDIYYNNVDIICLTSSDDKIRSNEFNNVINELKEDYSSNNKGIILSLKDGQNELWDNYKTDEIIDIYIKPYINKKYDMIISHDENGEYGNKQHMRVNMICIELSKQLDIKFMTFQSRFNITDLENSDYVEKRNKLLNMYKSQKFIIDGLNNFFIHKKIINNHKPINKIKRYIINSINK